MRCGQARCRPGRMSSTLPRSGGRVSPAGRMDDGAFGRAQPIEEHEQEATGGQGRSVASGRSRSSEAKRRRRRRLPGRRWYCDLDECRLACSWRETNLVEAQAGQAGGLATRRGRQRGLRRARHRVAGWRLTRVCAGLRSIATYWAAWRGWPPSNQRAMMPTSAGRPCTRRPSADRPRVLANWQLGKSPIAGRYQPLDADYGRMLRLTRKRFVGSYLALMVSRRR